MKIGSILQQKGSTVETIGPTATIASAAQTLAERGIGALVVTSDGANVSGIVSERDIVRSLQSAGGGVLERPVTEIMTSDVVTCRRDDTVDRLMGVMTNHRIRHLPVVEEEGLVGIISIGDVVKHRVGELESEARHMREYITTGR